MQTTNYTAIVDKDLKDLIPVFMKNRKNELDTLRSALGAGDYGQLQQLGHRMKGVGNSYGFAPISDLGKEIEDAAGNADSACVDGWIGAYADYLDHVKIVYE